MNGSERSRARLADQLDENYGVPREATMGADPWVLMKLLRALMWALTFGIIKPPWQKK